MRQVITTIEKLKEKQTALSTSVNNYQKQEEDIQAKIKEANKEQKKLEKEKEKSEEEYNTLGIKEAQAIKGKEKAEEKYKEAESKFEDLIDKINDATGILNVLNKNVVRAEELIETANVNKAKVIEKYYVEIRENCEKIKKLAR